MPASYARNLGGILGLPPERLLDVGTGGQSDADLAPPIWFKLRDPRLKSQDVEYIALVRHLAFLIDQFETVTNTPSVVWDSVFSAVRSSIDREGPPREQGRQAARILRRERGLNQGASGIGEVLRGSLRAMGVMVLEAPLHPSALEGCSFYVGASSAKNARPCVFANTHSTTWFRRNAIVAHEIDHLIFDARNSGASLDFKASDEGSAIASIASEGAEELISEERAEAFAQEMLVPAEVVRHASKGVEWATMTAEDLARIVATTHVEKGMLIRAALDANLTDQVSADHARTLDISEILPTLSERALDAVQYFKAHPEAAVWLEKRLTETTPILRLPVSYVKAVVEAVSASTIAWSKGAELLMIDRHTFQQRFGDLIPATAE
jgi:Zn-dependent peptidase ImmA (M78 family)